MEIIAQITGLLAVSTFLLSYQQKKRKNIILCNVISRVLYIVQYLILGAFEGAVLDILGTASSVFAQNKNKGFISRHTTAVLIFINLIIIAAGMLLYENIFSIFPIIGVILHTSAFWITDEKSIRRVSFLGSPFWFIYNFASKAYGSSIGDILSMVSIGIAIYRYDIKKTKTQ